MLLPVGIEPRTSVFQVSHAPVWAYSLFSCKPETLDPVMLYWFYLNQVHESSDVFTKDSVKIP